MERAERRWPEWPFNSANYTPYLEHGSRIRNSLTTFESSLLSDETAVCVLGAEKTGSARKFVCNQDQLVSYLEDADLDSQLHHALFVNRFLVRDKNANLPADSNKLRLSKGALHYLIYRLEIAPAFVFSLSRYFLPNGRGYRALTQPDGDIVHHLWCFLPVRFQSACTDHDQEHVASTAGSNQMNPFHYLHLKEPQVDIRGSQIALYARFSVKKRSSVVLAVSLLDGRWKRTVEQPQARIAESLNMPDSRSQRVLENPFFVFIIHLTTALEWWINALHSFDEQLIDHEKSLQNQLDRKEGTSSAVYTSINRALHAMSAHLSRFGSELASTEDTISDLMARHRTIFGSSNTAITTGSHSTTTSTTEAACAVAEIENSLAEAKGQAQVAMSMRLELEHKTQNILALLFNRIQLSTDTVLIENGKSMEGIMGALKDEAQASYDLADAQQQMTQDMKEDSVAMKTIAVLTMFFLPGTSFAAILAMPFFATNTWLTHASRFWLWFVLTVPSTGLSILFYKYWRENHARANQKSKGTGRSQQNPHNHAVDLEMNNVNVDHVRNDGVDNNAR